MIYQSRGLFTFANQRKANVLVTLIFVTSVASGDGSYENSETEVELKADFTDLSPDQIQRLKTDGITTNENITLTVPQEFDFAPSRCIVGNNSFTVQPNFVINEGCTILTLAQRTLEKAEEY